MAERTFDEIIERWRATEFSDECGPVPAIALQLKDAFLADLEALRRLYHRSACFTLWVWEKNSDSPLVGGVVRLSDYQPGQAIPFPMSEARLRYFELCWPRILRYDVCLVAAGSRWDAYQPNAVVLATRHAEINAEHWPNHLSPGREFYAELVMRPS